MHWSWSRLKNEVAFCNPREKVFRLVIERVKRDGMLHESSIVNELQRLHQAYAFY